MQNAELLAERDAGAAVGAPQDLLSAVERHRADRLAFTDHRTRRSMTFGELRDAARRSAARLRQLEVRRGDAIAFFAEGGFDLMPMLLACSGAGVRLVVLDATRPGPTAAAAVEHCRPKLLVVPEGRQEVRGLGGGSAPVLTHDDWFRDGGCAAAGAAPWQDRFDSADEPCVAVFTSGTTAEPKPVLLTPACLLARARAFLDGCRVTAEDTVFAASPQFTPNGLGIAGVIPMVAGAHVVLADGRAWPDAGAYWAAVSRSGATVCELPAWRIRPLLGSAVPERAVSDRLRLVLCSGGGLSDAQRRAAEAALGRRIHQGYGTAETGYWTACTPRSPDGSRPSPGLEPSAGIELRIRPLRQPLTLLRRAAPPGEAGTEPPAREQAFGEILVRGAAVSPGYHRKRNATHVAFEDGYFRTGDVGCFDGNGGLVVLGRCDDLVVRERTGVLLSDIDAALGAHPAVIESKTIRDGAAGHRDRITSVCVAAEPVPDLGAWLAGRVGAAWRPDRIVFAPALPRGLGGEVSADLLRSVMNGQLRAGIVDALAGRKFRRDAPHDEAALRALVQEAVLGHEPLRFLMFWGCGPRRHVAEPELAALAALRELLDAARPAPWMRARADIVLTDVHAAANGHPEDHFSAYFGQVEQAAAGLDASFAFESRVWRSHGLSVDHVRRFAATPELEEEWRRFPLRERFVEQASRHSSAADREAAAKHYFATCKLERRMLAAAYPRSVFLTYNGPEFNECFPDLPTLYIYPGPRGRTVKPWFA